MLIKIPDESVREAWKNAFNDRVNANYKAALLQVRASYRLWVLKEQMSQLMASYPHSDMAVSDPKFCALKDAIAAVETELN